MRTFTQSLFSIRNLILVLLAILTARSFSATIGILDDFNQPFPIRSIGLETSARPILNQNVLLHGWIRDHGVEAISLPEGRHVTAEIADDFGLFVVSYDPGVDARTWLSYQAPTGMSFDLTRANAANNLALMIEFSRNPFHIELLLASVGGEVESHRIRQPSSLLAQQVSIPLDLFQGVDLEQISSLEIAIHNVADQGAPDVVISQVALLSRETANIPEPSTMLFVALAASGVCLRRNRNVLS